MSFLKYSEDADIRTGNGRGGLSFARAHVDNMPFRGPTTPLKDEEYREFTEVVNDFDAKVFDIRDPKEYAEMKDIFDRAVNGWYNILDIDKQWGETKDGRKTVFVFVMYSIPHRELAKGRAHAQLMPKQIP